MHSYENSPSMDNNNLSLIGKGSSCPSVLHFIPPFGLETSGSREESVSRGDLRVEGKRFALEGI